jgi:hypothetical protein
MLQGMTVRLTEIGDATEWKYGGKTKVIRIPRQPLPVYIMIDQEQL